MLQGLSRSQPVQKVIVAVAALLWVRNDLQSQDRVQQSVQRLEQELVQSIDRVDRRLAALDASCESCASEKCAPDPELSTNLSLFLNQSRDILENHSSQNCTIVTDAVQKPDSPTAAQSLVQFGISFIALSSWQLLTCCKYGRGTGGRAEVRQYPRPGRRGGGVLE